MIGRRQFLLRAGSLAGLPFFFSADSLLAATSESRRLASLVFEEFASSCIDLGHYDQKRKELTVRFVGRKAEKFYRYANVPPEIWKKLRQLNASGGVGGYLNETVVQNPKAFPFKEIVIQKPKLSKSKKRTDTQAEK